MTAPTNVANRNLILAGMNGGGAAGTALANFGPLGTPMPSSIVPGTAALPNPAYDLDPDFLDAGWITEDGLTRAVDVNTNEVNAYGSAVPVRIIKTTRTVTFTIGFLESNPVSLAIYHELPLAGPKALVVDPTDKTLYFTEGRARTQLYAGVFDIVDGDNQIRALVPQLEVTGQEDFSAQPGSAITYGVTFTAYPGSDGVAIQWQYRIPGY
jgi:hypothetical protein